jgi:hypothetical protein
MSRVVLSRKLRCTVVEGCDVRRKHTVHMRCIAMNLNDPGFLVIAKKCDKGSLGIERWTFVGGRWTTVESVTVLPEPVAVSS